MFLILKKIVNFVKGHCVVLVLCMLIKCHKQTQISSIGYWICVLTGKFVKFPQLFSSYSEMLQMLRLPKLLNPAIDRNLNKHVSLLTFQNRKLPIWTCGNYLNVKFAHFSSSFFIDH